MARVTLSALISDINGKMNGTVFQRTQGGLCMRNQGGKLFSNTDRDNLHRNSIADIQFQWQNMTVNERLLWQTYSVYLNKKQKKNPNLIINGHQLFININSIRYDLSSSNSLFQPYLLDTPVLSPLPQPIQITSIKRNGVALEVNLDRVIDQTKEVIICFLSYPLKGSQLSKYYKTLLMKSPTVSGTKFETNAYYTNTYGRNANVNDWLQTKIAIYSTIGQNYSNFSIGRFQVV